MDNPNPPGQRYDLRSSAGSDPRPHTPGPTPRSRSSNLIAQRTNVPSLVINGIVPNTTTTSNLVSSTPYQSPTRTPSNNETPSNLKRYVPEDHYHTTPIW